MDVPLPYEPVKCGTLQGYGKATVYGCTYDHSNMLVALSVQAPTISIEQIHYALQGQEHQLTVSETGGNNRYPYSRKCHYRIIKTPIPDTSEVSMIMLNDTLFKIVQDREYSHLWYHSAEQFKEEVFQRVRDLVYIPVKREWAHYLVIQGMAAMVWNRPLVGQFTYMGSKEQQDRASLNWMSAGFSIGYIRAEREAWEKLIAKGLREKMITI